MKIEFRLITAAVTAVVLISTPLLRWRVPGRWMKTLRSRYSSAPLNAIASTKSESHWIASRTALKRKNGYFEFVLREIHNAKCGGDPETNPAIDRYRVYRHSGKNPAMGSG